MCVAAGFDYGNAENVTTAGNAGPMKDGTMEAVYFGSGYAPHGKGSGSGPWIGADMENGIYEGASNQASVPSLKPSDFVVGFVKGKPGNHYEIKSGNPQAGSALHAQYAGPRPKGCACSTAPPSHSSPPTPKESFCHGLGCDQCSAVLFFGSVCPRFAAGSQPCRQLGSLTRRPDALPDALCDA